MALAVPELAAARRGEHSVLFSAHITSDLDRIGDYVTIIHDGRIVFTGTKDRLLDVYHIVRGGPNDLRERIGVDLIGVRRTSTGTQALVRTEEADFVDGDVLVEAPTLEEIAVHTGARSPAESGSRHGPARSPPTGRPTRVRRFDEHRGERMTALARMAMLDLRSVAPFRNQPWPFSSPGPRPPRSTATLVTELTVSWALFALNVAIQFPLFIRFGYTRIGALAPPCRWR